MSTMKRTKVINLDGAQFEELRWEGRMKACVGYAVTTSQGWWGDPVTQYAWSPDGEGCFWYETVCEMMYEHGTEQDWDDYGCTPDGYIDRQAVQERRRA